MTEFEKNLTYKIDTVIDDGDDAKTLELFIRLWVNRKLITEEHHLLSLDHLRAEMTRVEDSRAMRIIRDAAALLKRDAQHREPSDDN